MFVVSNIIIIFLVGESRLFKSSAQPDTYDECMMRSQVPQLVATVGVKEEEANVEEEPSVDKAKEEEEVEEEGRPAEELNRRVEDFIAKVTMQRKEARSQHAHVLSAKSGGRQTEEKTRGKHRQ
ncbi:hypothetical protein B296_00011327 [Ensete ventricosum]|uniref:DUF4408 domain-containing protein n=1 Tax=Ensete ventricosum TaxID=4639 RepID=A0A427A126_ENSVE|nr:hypothetical protein B296_00011327 [Ensete ventricosum]